MADQRDDDATRKRNVPQDTPPAGYRVPDEQQTRAGQGAGDQPTRVGARGSVDEEA